MVFNTHRSRVMRRQARKRRLSEPRTGYERCWLAQTSSLADDGCL